ncbi:ATP-binding protein [Microbacterium sp. MPKO10]|uniref:ATP-binding protein n=1 Tax=Microbacterium sp. MPKO10 TaxID=2989818 RepID=UPI002235A353|nr:DUF4143 domain-containing protein [Microbacterium sp. MPKO10]MCW4457416.1 DUF4143 domain-containing protein [Microbacterium sp. MPKO10]
MDYVARCIDQRILRSLGAMGAVFIEGPRACGKTSTGLQHARSSIRLDESPQLVALAELDPRSLLIGEAPRLIDEWQLAPAIWNVIRHEIDDRQLSGQFIVSGSARPADDVRRHSGAGRISRARMRTMSLAESGRSSGDVSLSELDAVGQLSGVRSHLTYQDLAAEAVRGGWPTLLEATTEDAIEFNESYSADLMAVDVIQAGGVRHDPAKMRRLLVSLARNVSAEVSIAKLVDDVASNGVEIGRNTVSDYLDALRAVFAIEEIPAWAASLRSRTRLRQQPKRHLADPALACALLGLSAARLARDPEYFGQVFEAMAIRDLQVYVERNGGHVYHYRDSGGLEADAIVEYRDGSWAAIEVKLGASKIAEAEANLLKLRDERIDLERMGTPRFMAVVTGTEYGYTMPSGVHVIPLGALSA